MHVGLGAADEEVEAERCLAPHSGYLGYRLLSTVACQGSLWVIGLWPPGGVGRLWVIWVMEGSELMWEGYGVMAYTAVCPSFPFALCMRYPIASSRVRVPPYGLGTS